MFNILCLLLTFHIVQARPPSFRAAIRLAYFAFKKMEPFKKEKKVRITVNLDASNATLLKWLKLNWGDDFSFTVNSLLTRYKNEVTAGMTDYEREQIENLKVVSERGAIDAEKIKDLRATLLMEKVDATLQDTKKRKALKNLIDLYEKKII